MLDPSSGFLVSNIAQYSVAEPGSERLALDVGLQYFGVVGLPRM